MPIVVAPLSNALTAEQIAHLKEKAMFVRTETVRLIAIAKVGHYSSTFSCAEILSVLYYDAMRLSRGEPRWQERDRFLMGKGHAAVGLYPLLADWGFFPPELLDSYTRLGSPLGDHPDMRLVPGVDFSSGSIGHALSGALGMVLGGRMQKQEFDVYVLLGDGEMQEGSIWEAIMMAANLRLDRLVAFADVNDFQGLGRTSETHPAFYPVPDKAVAFGWEAREVNGHDHRALLEALQGRRGDRFASLGKLDQGVGQGREARGPRVELPVLPAVGAERCHAAPSWPVISARTRASSSGAR